MGENNKLKSANTTVPQSADDNCSQKASPVLRHLGLIKAMSIIMAVLIVTALVVIVTTIYSRLTTVKNFNVHAEVELVIPPQSHISSASSDEKGSLVLVIESATGQQIWQLDPAGKIKRKTKVVSTP